MAGPPPRLKKYRRDESEVSCCLKYLIFGFNVIFWLMGLFILGVGVWAWSEKETLSNLSKLTRVALDPAFILVLVGSMTFVIGFTGCVGALRENTCLLAVYAIFLAAILLVEISAGILGFMFKDWIKGEATSGFQSFIISYREDPDQQNLIDWIQERWLQCCGIEGARDWDKNVYFNCNSTAREACGVPFSCCKQPMEQLWIRNTQCGYDVRKPEYNLDVSKVIYETGCLSSAEDWLERNLIMVAAAIVATAFLQILGICFAQNLRADVFAQRSKWR
ncbi:tetraspanin-5 [Folsomia candida]|uniref:tetraspanin-5 n=1 Tax=Folsomia candida TaxID=158441 RepID=UPI000B8FCFCF|nr:tetraspanin-5 [Folsomia candida]